MVDLPASHVSFQGGNINHHQPKLWNPFLGIIQRKKCEQRPYVENSWSNLSPNPGPLNHTYSSTKMSRDNTPHLWEVDLDSDSYKHFTAWISKVCLHFFSEDTIIVYQTLYIIHNVSKNSSFPLTWPSCATVKICTVQVSHNTWSQRSCLTMLECQGSSWTPQSTYINVVFFEAKRRDTASKDIDTRKA